MVGIQKKVNGSYNLNVEVEDENENMVEIQNGILDKNLAELDDWLGDLNPESKVVIQNAYVVPSVSKAALGDRFQFERLGYFAVDKDSTL
ncbi:hypothetical protein CQW23_14859 [Capsicum baccatum]|uniref:tRNA synthetases class I (E and Q) anti-codon binding domain-containing protein n=1 Tax=Capsicum baccatum TaxID=33114 RepID=A0A2G2WKE5_CAPBA|nr:hypothetical protein CQW23_14859 [Capsicum baccatum]